MDSLERDTIRRVLAGDADSYRVLMDRHLAAVLQMTYRVTGSMEDAEEAAQEAFLRAYNKLPTFREDAAFGTWVYRIAMNCALNLIARRERNPAWDAVSLDGAGRASTGRGETGRGEELLVSDRPTPEGVLLEAEAARGGERLLHCLTCLTPMERVAFVLRHLEEQPVGVIAAALGITANTARQTIFRAVSKLRRELAPSRAAALTPFSQSRLAREPQ